MKRTVGLRCTICNHPARPQIDLAIATGLSKRAVAARFVVSRDAVWWHAQAHLTAEMRAALATKLLQREGDTRHILLEEGAGVTEALKAIRGPLFCLYLAAVDTGDSKAAAALSGRLHGKSGARREANRGARAACRHHHYQHSSVARFSAVAYRADTGARAISRGAGGGCCGFPPGGVAGGHRDGCLAGKDHRSASR